MLEQNLLYIKQIINSFLNEESLAKSTNSEWEQIESTAIESPLFAIKVLNTNIKLFSDICNELFEGVSKGYQIGLFKDVDFLIEKRQQFHEFVLKTMKAESVVAYGGFSMLSIK